MSFITHYAAEKKTTACKKTVTRMMPVVRVFDGLLDTSQLSLHDAHLEQACRDNCGALRNGFVDTARNEEDDPNNEWSDRLCLRPLRQVVKSLHEDMTRRSDLRLT